MKKILLGSFSLLILSCAILIFQISCTKSVDAQTGNNGGNYTLPIASNSTLGGIMVGTGLSISSTGVLSVNNSGTNPGTGTGTTQQNKIVFTKDNREGADIWIMNYDGTGQTKVNITLPAGIVIGDDVKISPDNTKLFFVTIDTNITNANKEDIYTCDIDGKNVKKIYDMGAAQNGHTGLAAAF